MQKRFYLDYNATTPVHPEVNRLMHLFLEENFGNPSSIHSFGRAARIAIDEARHGLAQCIRAKDKEIIFTSGGTESNNFAILGAARANSSKGNHIVTSSIEHHAVLHPCQRLETEKFHITYLPVDSSGSIDFEKFADSLRPDTILVSIMSANNETGAFQPVRKIGALCRQRKILFHCDAVQSFGKQPVDVEDWGVDLLSVSGHKFYGPKGVGFLFVRSGCLIESLQLGGFHENERRAGTENVAGIIGMARAAQLVAQEMTTENQRLYELTEKLWKVLSSSIPTVRRNGHSEQRLGNTLNVSFDCEDDGLLMALDLEGIAVSSGSACMVGSMQPSHVLRAMDLEEKFIRSAIRFSFGKDSREEDIPEIVDRVKKVVTRFVKAKAA